MKHVFNLFLLLGAFFIIENKSYSLTEYQIVKICRKEKSQFSCVKKLKEKKANLEKGNSIEIPVIHYKK